MKITRKYLEFAARSRGVPAWQAMRCVEKEDGNVLEVNLSHPDWPGHHNQPRGPGCELKSLLAGWPFRITSSEGCSCTEMATKMDQMGCDWCESPEGAAEILAAMRENAEKKGIPYIEAAAKMLVRRAIRNARRNAPK